MDGQTDHHLKIKSASGAKNRPKYHYCQKIVKWSKIAKNCKKKRLKVSKIVKMLKC